MSAKRAWVTGIIGLLCCSLSLVACVPEPSAPEESAAESTETTESTEAFTVGAIPDQDAEKLQRLYTRLAEYLTTELGVPVEYKPVTDYTAAVTAFKVGDLDLVWFGGLTGVQARLQVEGAEAIAQRDIDAQFHSVFIANASSNLSEISDIAELAQLKGRSFTFGSESSTSGRLMPQYFLQQAGISLSDFKGEAGFAGNHDAILKLVEAGTYEAGALNEQVWNTRLEEGAIDTNKVKVIWRTPAYYDYHWVINPAVEDQYGEGFSEKVQAALLNLDPANPEHQEILELFGAEKFVETQNGNYAQIEQIAREIGKIQ
ncbi:MAG: putative selenate ABC transporter substrate-binding protein [Leptolyngbyaceae cyanobacterium SM1_1_3]|nr:putative selenate ABC transporter substrate-binding protein [Leptolyngbyaceae cyanobacterium SM1_1_3]NJN04547.1 putative selenate ABC transporter substrate-binding protein [Leptolyngbyaceae cyanobacterium RM1_1_2]NJO10962.1 putative selenate ABC transporter substrate-binding protein [Leptolyngbyaceae cyanobacterium SL_1_1]